MIPRWELEAVNRTCRANVCVSNEVSELAGYYGSGRSGYASR
jgi:hypothetical protein